MRKKEFRENGRRRWFGLALRLGCIAVLLVPVGWQLYCLYLSQQVRLLALPPHFGNRPDNVRAASTEGAADAAMGQAKPRELKFLVAGDSQSRGTFESLMDELERLKPDFAVLLGDITRHATEGDHQFLQLEMAEEMATDFPVFYVVGNHDIGPGFSLARWEQTYGPSQFWFVRGGTLFIIVHITRDPAQAAAGIDFLEETLEAHASSADHIFVFNHVPPEFSAAYAHDPPAGQERLLDLLARHGVNYFIAGHYHGYVRIERGRTNFIVSGGGGASLRGGSLGFHHGMVFTVRPDAVEERICVMPASLALEDRLESAAIARSIPFIRKHPWAVGGADAGILAVLCVLFIATVRHVRRPGTSPGGGAAPEPAPEPVPDSAVSADIT